MREELTEDEQSVAGLCERLVADMALLRAFPVPPHDAQPSAVHEAIIELRARLDLAEGLMTEMARRRRKARRVARQRSEAADDSYDAEMARLAERAIRLEYQGVRDRIAMAQVHASAYRRKARQAERLADLIEEAEDAVKSAFFGLRDIRKELLSRQDSYLPWLHHLEV
jgi:hypothetical protein